MSTECGLIFTGYFTRKVIDYLEYDPSVYEDMPEDQSMAFRVHFTSSIKGSTKFAKALGASLREFSTHCIDPDNIDYKALSEIDEIEDIDIEQIKVLSENGFSIYLSVDM